MDKKKAHSIESISINIVGKVHSTILYTFATLASHRLGMLCAYIIRSEKFLIEIPPSLPLTASEEHSERIGPQGRPKMVWICIPYKCKIRRRETKDNKDKFWIQQLSCSCQSP